MALAISAAAAQSPSCSSYNGFDVSVLLIPVQAIERGGPPRDGIPAIDRPKFVAAGGSGCSRRHRAANRSRRGRAGDSVTWGSCPPVPTLESAARR